ncbi:hypothetical protein ACVBEH_05000 [Roseateles sp. GG27B]
MRALDKFLSAHGDMRKFGIHYRGACLACKARNKTTLSIREGDTGNLLVRCFRGGCDPEAIAGSVGLSLEDLFPERMTGHHNTGPKRRAMLTANEALDLLEGDALIVWVASGNLAAGYALTEQDRARLNHACARIESLYVEVHQ